MTSKHAWAALAVVGLLLVPIDADAQGRGRGNGKAGKHGNGNGPAFCRSGEGHPVHGWQWCRDKGWTRDGVGDWRDRARGRVGRDRDRDRDDRDRERDDQERARRRWPIDDWR